MRPRREASGAGPDPGGAAPRARRRRSAEAIARADEIRAAVRAAGGRVTAARGALIDALVDALIDSRHHLTADDLAAAVQRLHPDVAISTVYRALEQLEELGVVVHVHLGHGAAVYHFADDAHVHLVCHGCGVEVALPAPVAREVAALIRTATGFDTDLAHFSITGRCAHCQR